MTGASSDPRVLARAAFFAGMAERVSDAFPVLRRATEFRADCPVLLSAVYFLLSDSYKQVRNLPSSLTDEYKRAALSAISVMVVRPFSPLDPDNISDLTVYLANPILALACANAWAKQRDLFRHYPFDYLKRFHHSLLTIRMPSLDAFVEAVNEGRDYRAIRSIELSTREVALIDEWVLKIHLLCNQKR